MLPKQNPYRPPGSAIPQEDVSAADSATENSMLLAIGVIMGIELVGVPLIVVLVLSLNVNFISHPFWLLLSVLTVSATLAGMMFAKLLRLAELREDDSDDLENGNLFGEPSGSSAHSP